MRSPVNHLLRQIGFMVIVAEGSLYDLPSSLRLLPAVVIDAGKHGSWGRIMNTLMGDEHHRAGLGMLLGEDIKERSGLIVAVMALLDHLLVSPVGRLRAAYPGPSRGTERTGCGAPEWSRSFFRMGGRPIPPRCSRCWMNGWHVC